MRPEVFKMIDRVVSIDPSLNKIHCQGLVPQESSIFEGHFPGYPIMPGVLQLEALAQVAGVLLLRKLEHTGRIALMIGMDSVKLRRPVLPGDQMILEAEAVRIRSRSAQVNARATVTGEVTCEAQMKFMLVDADLL